MNTQNNNQQIRKALTELAAAHAHAVTEIERAIEGLSSLLKLQENSEALIAGNVSTNRLRPRADRETLCVVWKNRTCFLGNTLLFLFFERLARSPNHYVSHVDLLEDVWGGEREGSTIRGVAKRLRDRLNEAGMSKLAKAIDGSVTGYYSLKIV